MKRARKHGQPKGILLIRPDYMKFRGAKSTSLQNKLKLAESKTDCNGIYGIMALKEGRFSITTMPRETIGVYKCSSIFNHVRNYPDIATE